MILVVWGRRVHALYEGRREARCGRCLVKTQQAVSTLQARSHVYFIEYNAEDVGRVSQCETCGNTVPILARAEGGPKRSSRERWIDSFLDAHLLEITRGDRGTVVGVVLVLMALVALVCFVWIASMLALPAELWALGVLALVALVLGAVVRFAYLRSQRVIGDALFARSVRPRLAMLREKLDVGPRDLAARASTLGYARLAQHFDLPRYAVHAPPGQGPYRGPSA